MRGAFRLGDTPDNIQASLETARYIAERYKEWEGRKDGIVGSRECAQICCLSRITCGSTLRITSSGPSRTEGQVTVINLFRYLRT